jgi:hypothetical protein
MQPENKTILNRYNPFKGFVYQTKRFDRRVSRGRRARSTSGESASQRARWALTVSEGGPWLRPTGAHANRRPLTQALACAPVNTHWATSVRV